MPKSPAAIRVGARLLFQLAAAGAVCAQDGPSLEPAAHSRRLAGQHHASRVLYIHVGKCGGSTVWSWLRHAGVDFDEVHLHRPANTQERAYSKFVVWVRDPVDRFVSAFNYEKAVLLTNVSGLSLGHGRVCNLSRACLSPERLEDKVRRGHAYPQRLEDLIMHFKDANAVGEALTACSSDSEPLRRDCMMAHELMHYPTEHINKGVGFYLHDGAFVGRHADQMFVGSQERMQEDLVRLGRWLGKNSSRPVPMSRASYGEKGLSLLARANIRAYYNKSNPDYPPAYFQYVSADYEAMRALVKFGLLDADRYELT